jgi:hypothetical protein
MGNVQVAMLAGAMKQISLHSDTLVFFGATGDLAY